jgi:transmembrane sensor
MKNRITSEEKDLLIRCINGDATPDELQQAWLWVHSDDLHYQYYKNLRDSRIALSVHTNRDDDSLEKSWKRLEKKLTVHPKVKRVYAGDIIKNSFSITLTWKRLVAAVLIACILGSAATLLALKYAEMQDANLYFSVEAPRGAKSLVNLADGSQVWLNAGSSLRYPLKFNRSNRDVFLQGEAYFVVAKRKDLPFRVHASDVVVEALGTEFNVKAYPEEGRIETTLVKGAVSITGAHLNKESIVLKPNQKASFVTGIQPDNVPLIAESSHDAAISPVIAMQPARIRLENNVNTEPIISWKDKRWIFVRESIESLAIKLERQYDVKVVFLDDRIREFHLSGTLEEESIEQVLQAVQLTLPINFEVKHNTVTLSINEQKLKKFKQLIRI